MICGVHTEYDKQATTTGNTPHPALHKDIIEIGEGKGKFVRIHTLKAHRGSRGIAPLILNLGTGWRSAVNFTPRPVYLQEINPVPIQ